MLSNRQNHTQNQIIQYQTLHLIRQPQKQVLNKFEPPKQKDLTMINQYSLKTLIQSIKFTTNYVHNINSTHFQS